MTDRCEKCGRPIVATHHPDADDCSQDFGGSPDATCHLIHDAYLRGLREGVEVAKVYTRAEADVDALGRAVGWVSWDDVEAELERRLK